MLLSEQLYITLFGMTFLGLCVSLIYGRQTPAQQQLNVLLDKLTALRQNLEQGTREAEVERVRLKRELKAERSAREYTETLLKAAKKAIQDQVQSQTLDRDLRHLRRDLAKVTQELADTKEELSAAKHELETHDASEDALLSTKEVLDAAKQALSDRNRELVEAHETLRKRDRELAEAHETLRERDRTICDLEEQLSDSDSDSDYSDGETTLKVFFTEAGGSLHLDKECRHLEGREVLESVINDHLDGVLRAKRVYCRTCQGESAKVEMGDKMSPRPFHWKGSIPPL